MLILDARVHAFLRGWVKRQQQRSRRLVQGRYVVPPKRGNVERIPGCQHALVHLPDDVRDLGVFLPLCIRGIFVVR